MKILCLDVGNTQIHGGVFIGEKLKAQFRYPTKPMPTSDQFGVFLKQVLSHHELVIGSIEAVSICSVVPALDYSLRSAVKKYIGLDAFMLQPGTKTGLQIQYRNPLEVGADRIANAIAATAIYPGKNCLIFDFGTATTCCVVTADKKYLGGVIMPGLRLSMEALQLNTAKLNAVEIIQPKQRIGRSATESMQSGLFYSQLAAIQALSKDIIEEHFAGKADKPVIIATGGFANLFEPHSCFDFVVSDLVLQGLRKAYILNQDLVT